MPVVLWSNNTASGLYLREEKILRNFVNNSVKSPVYD